MSKQKFSVSIKSDAYQKLITQTLGDKNKTIKFITAISSAVATTPSLQNCDAGTILSGALVAESLCLAHSPSLGHYYLVPYGDKAQFILGYKGYVQLAIRSGQYKRINVVSIKDGELISYNPFTEEAELEAITDPDAREKATTVGYYAEFELINGFTKSIYWSKEKMMNHAKKYSKAFTGRTHDSFWHKDFDMMAYKTLLRQIIGKWGIMSIEMITAYSHDMAVIKTDGTYDYVDNDNNNITGSSQIIEQQDDNLNANVNNETGEVTLSSLV